MFYYFYLYFLFIRSPNNEELLEKLVLQMKEMLAQQQEQQKSLSEQQNTASSNNKNISNTAEGYNRRPSEAAATAEGEKQDLKNRQLKSELMTLQKELALKSKELSEKEETLLFDVKNFKNQQKAEKEKQNAKIYLSSIDNLAALKQPANEEFFMELREKSRLVSAVTIKSLFVQGKFFY